MSHPAFACPARPMIIQTACLEDMAILVDWAAAEGWNPGLADAVPFHAADPEGFLIGRVGGQAVATISAVRYPENFGFIGFYIVHPQWRGQGFGWTIWQAAMLRLAGCNVALDGVLAEQENYQRSGFRLAWRNIRYEGVKGASFPANTAATDPFVFIELTSVPPEMLSAVDRNYFPAERTAFLHAWIRQPGTVALAIREKGQIAGYGVIRPCKAGWKIGPLCARSEAHAKALVARLLEGVPSRQTFYLDVPTPNTAAIALAESLGMAAVFETARMYTSAPPPMTMGEIYGITSFELG